MDSSKIFFLISRQKHVVIPHYKRLGKTILMIGHNICFKEIICKMSLKYSDPFIPSYLEHCVTSASRRKEKISTNLAQ